MKDKYKYIELIELLFLTFFIVYFGNLCARLDYSVRSAETIATIFFNYFSLIIVSLIYFSVSQDQGRTATDKHAFMLMIYMASLITCFETLNSIMDGDPTKTQFLLYTSSISYIGNICLGCLFYFYIRVTPEAEHHNFVLLDRLVMIITFISVIVGIYNIKSGVFFSINDEGYFMVNPDIPYASFIAPIIILFLANVPIYRGSFSKTDKNVLSSFKYIIIIVAIVCNVSPSLVLVEPAKIVGIFVIYCQFYVKHSRKVIEQQYALVEQQALLTKEKGNLMLSQIQPHFVYNGLLSIRSMIKRNPEEAEKALGNFMTYLIGSINRLSSEDLIDLDDEVDFIKTYLECQKVRYGDDVTYEIHTEPTSVKVPPITIQPLVESAVENGIRRSANGCGHVSVDVVRIEDGAKIVIKDDGIGFDANKGEETNIEHMAIKHALERLKDYHAELIIDAEEQKGTTLTVIIKTGEVLYV